MRNDAVLAPAFNKQEPIPGYFTKELIGAGGYGEVWKTHAPGGLVKAIKFVYAGANCKRASREIRSLNRIKEVRHPFLLSIERIEVIEGNVVIVTELADGSLKRHYQKYRTNENIGIPRDELLGYMRDTADALDYIYENYSLQHLDVKPENLLLVGGRAKVADFGLIKNLYDRSVSLIEGLTPIYAPPELFEGKPNRHSDQYSLAIVFQEMLTGELPFDGTTPARLAAQHLQTPPVLSSLPKYDQPIVARALSKDPEQRFASCREMVEALVESGKGKSKSAARHALTSLATESPLRPPGHAEPDALTISVDVHPVADMPSINFDMDQAVEYGPVLFIGLGGCATRVFRRLRRRLCDRLGTMDAIPSVEMILLDTDARSVSTATEGEPGTALDASETLATPLRRTEDYRSAAGSILNSISRRWLYNLPFSLQTEGFRPLGRLAMVDHSRRVFERIRQAIAKITREENMIHTARTTGLELITRQPRVFIVGSIAGGTGGGMALDLAYAVRSLLTQADLPDTQVHGVLLHSTSRVASERDKAIANSYATLSELWHYSSPGRCYPGDRACGVPAFHGNNRTFSSCYFVHLGDDLTEPQLDSATDPVAEYLYTSALTGAVQYFDQCRRTDLSNQASGSSRLMLRSFGLCQLGGSNSDIPSIVAELLCRDLVSKWRTGTTPVVQRPSPRLNETMALIAAHDETNLPRFSSIDVEAAAQVAELEIDGDRMSAVAREILDQEVSSDVDGYFAKLIADAFDWSRTEPDRKELLRVIAIVDAVLGIGSEDAVEGGFNSLGSVLHTRLEGRAGKLASAIGEWIIDYVDSTHGVEGARYAANWLENHLRKLQGSAVNLAGQLREQTRSLQDSMLHRADEPAQAAGRRIDTRTRETQSRVYHYARLRIELITCTAVTRWLRLIELRVTEKLERLHEFWKDLEALATMFQVTPSLDEAFDDCNVPEIVPSYWRGLLGDLMERRVELVSALDRMIEQKLNLGQAKLRWYLTQSCPVQSQLVAPLRASARQLILAAMQDLNISRLSNDAQEPSSADSSEYSRCVEAARPRLADDSMATRLLLVVPENVNEGWALRDLTSGNGCPAAVVRSTGGDFIACQEVEGLEIHRVAAKLV
ncbi:MAG TPA: tubulin-like doman-containing protein, partial [Pirellulales bacterium]|nr:tubulin-like doman-containing protein [Pirellulales bacterium]